MSETDVCSIYLLDERTQRLRLAATAGLEQSAVGKVTMSVGEGLTGMAIEKLEPVMAVDAFSHPRYKYFPETGEERYHSFARRADRRARDAARRAGRADAPAPALLARTRCALLRAIATAGERHHRAGAPASRT